MNTPKQLCREYLLGQAMETWMVTEEECGVQKSFLFYVKRGACRVCMLLEMSQRRKCFLSFILFAFPN